MWPKRPTEQDGPGDDPAGLTLGELMATQPRHVRGKLMPGERFPTGLRPGRRRAQGSDIDSIGPYVPGDDVRWIDWRATARTGRAQMKRFVAESHLARMLVVDLRADLFFGTSDRPMAKTACLLAAHLAWEGFALQEPVGLVLVPSGTTLRPRRGRGHILNLLRHLEEAYAAARASPSPGEDDAMAHAIDAASMLLGPGDEVCVFSDFGDLPDSLVQKVRELSAVRKFRAVLVEDRMLRGAARPGRFPYHTARAPERNLASVPNASPDVLAEAVRDLRRSLRRALIRDGWRITEATEAAIPLPGASR